MVLYRQGTLYDLYQLRKILRRINLLARNKQGDPGRVFLENCWKRGIAPTRILLLKLITVQKDNVMRQRRDEILPRLVHRGNGIGQPA